MGIQHNFPSGRVSVLLLKSINLVERQAVQWVTGLDKTGSDGVGNEDPGTKPDGEKCHVGQKLHKYFGQWPKTGAPGAFWPKTNVP